MLKIAVVGATGLVGETIVRVLLERNVPIEELGLFASRSRNGVRKTTSEALQDYDAVFFAGSEDASERYADELLSNGAIIIDNSPAFRLRRDVPLIVPGINADTLSDGQRLFPVANCTAIILCMALAPVNALAGLKRVIVSTYQAVSGAGREALEAFERGEGAFAGNVVPQIGNFDAAGESDEERKVAEETRKILSPFDDTLRAAQDDTFAIAVTAVRVPVLSAHCESVYFETLRDTSIDQLAKAFESMPGVIFHREGIVTPRDVQGTDDVHVCRLRAHGNREYQMWIAGDQLRKGAATTAVQLLELAVRRSG